MSGRVTGEEENMGKNRRERPQAASCLTWCSLGQAAQLLSVVPVYRALPTMSRTMEPDGAPQTAVHQLLVHQPILQARLPSCNT